MGLDGIELVMAVEEEFGISISDSEAELFFTPRDLIDHVSKKVNATSSDSAVTCVDLKCCRPQKAFYRIRRAIVKVTKVKRGSIKPSTDLLSVFPAKRCSRSWRDFKGEIGLGYCLMPSSRLTGRFAPKTVEDIVKKLVAKNPAFLNKVGGWKKEEVEIEIREIICNILSVSDFSDDDDFVRDLGVG